MNISKQNKRMDAYYTFEAALAYLTYTNIRNEPSMKQEIQKLIDKMQTNFDILSSGTSDK